MAAYQEDVIAMSPTAAEVQSLLVLGMHRSGTSAVAGTLTMLGGTPPKTLMGASEFNERGHWESNALMEFNDRLLRSAGSVWDDWRAVNPDWYQTGEVERFKREATDLIRTEYEGCSLMVFKDPRICRFAPFWLDVLTDMAATPKVVIPVRSPLEVAHSLKRRDGFPITKGVLLWLRHVLDAEWTTRGTPRVIFAWSSFLKDWRYTTDSIEREVGVSWPSLSEYSAQKIDDFLSSELRHEAIPDSRLRSHPEVDEWARLAYEAMLTLADEPDSEAAFSTLDDVRGSFERACKLFGRVALDYDRALAAQQSASDELCADRDRWLARSQGLEGELASRNQEIAELVEGLSQTQSERDRATTRLTELEAELAAAQAKAEKLAGLEAALSAAQAKAAKLPGLEAALVRLTSERDSALGELAAVKASSERFRDVLRWQLSLSQELATEVRKVRRQPWRPLAQRSLFYAFSLFAFLFSALAAPGRVGLFFQRQGDQRTPRRLGTLADDAERAKEQLLALEAEGDGARLSPAGVEEDSHFDADFYAQMYPEVVAAGFDPLVHFNTFGRQEGRLGGERSVILQIKEDERFIRESNVLDPEFSQEPGSNEERTFAYVRAWATGVERRKPFAGFHPGIYKEVHGLAVRGGDPLADYLRAGRPKGPWCAPVILPSLEASPVSGQRVALHLHAFYPDDVQGVMSALGATRTQIDLLVSVVDEAGRERVSEILKEYRGGGIDIRITPNVGRDLGPFCTAFADTIQREYDLIGHFHTKRSPGLDVEFTRRWVRFLFANLLGSEGHPAMADRILGVMAEDPTIGLVFPDDPHAYAWDQNRAFAEGLAQRLGIGRLPEHIIFPAGTMFWARVAALEPLWALKLDWQDYPKEPVPLDGTVLHALERMMTLIVNKAGFTHAVTHVPGVTR